MQIAINTGSISTDTVAAVAQAKALGFTALEVNLQQAELRYNYRRQPDLDFYETLAQEIKLRGMEVVAVHNLFLTGGQAFSIQARQELLSLAGRLTLQLGGSILIVQPPDLFISEESLYSYLSGASQTPPLITAFASIQDKLKQLGVSLALENVNCWHKALMDNQAEHVATLAETLDCYVALDVAQSLNRPSLSRWIELMGDRVALLRLYDRKNEWERHPPLDPVWHERVGVLKRTAARACVMDASADPLAHGNIRASLDLIKRLWSET